MIRHEKRDVQHVTIQFQIGERETDPKLDLIREQLLEFSEAFTGDISFRFDLDRENIILSLDQEIHFIRRICLRPIPRKHFKLRNQCLKNKIFRQGSLEFCE